MTKTAEKQQVATPLGNDQDVFGLYREGGLIEGQVLFVRGGKLVGNLAYSFTDNEFPDAEVVAEFLSQFLPERPIYPRRGFLSPLHLTMPTSGRNSSRNGRGKRSACSVRSAGAKLRLVEMAQENARHSFVEKRRGEEHKEKTLGNLRRALHLQNAPKRIECFDISNTQGNLSVGSMVVFDECEAG